MRWSLLTLIGALALASCGQLDTVGGHYPGMTLYQPAGEDFHLHYADPPWTLAEAGSDYGALQPDLVAKAVYLGLELDLEAYQLQVDRLDCTSAAAAAASAHTAAEAAGEVVDFGVRDLETTSGDLGYDLGTHDGSGSLKALLSHSTQGTVDDQGFTVRVRRVFFDAAAAGGGCYQVFVISVYELDEPDLTFMLRSFEPRRQVVGDGGGT